MTETFGHAWTSSYGIEPSAAWVDGLADMTLDDVRRGLQAVRDWAERFPPTLPQFRELCRPAQSPAHRDYVPLPQPASGWQARQAAAGSAFRDLRAGTLQPETTGRSYTLSEEDRAYLERLDWQRIMPTGPAQEPRRPLVRLRAPMDSSRGCTCRMTRGDERYVVERHTCPVCLAWDQRMTQMGVSAAAVAPVDDETGRTRRRRGRA